MDKDSFSFGLPLDVVKSENPETENEWRIGGYASTSTEDRQGDEIIQKGLDFSDFVNFGWFNHDHDNTKIVGYPDKSKCRLDSHGFYVEGTLLKGVELAKSIWETAVALKKSGAPRKLGFSVEGKVLKRNDLGQIIKAKIYNVAVTANPVNPTCTWDALVKSFTDQTTDIDHYTVEKSLEAGYGNSNGSVLIPESLESAFRTLSYIIGDDEEAKAHMNALKQKLEKKQEITKSELTLYFQLTKGLSFADSASLVNTIMNQVKED